jgi:cardiolipin synthase
MDEVVRAPTAGVLRRWRNALRRSLRAAGLHLRRMGALGRRHRLPASDLAARSEWLLSRLLVLGGASSGNSAEVMFDGDEVMESLWNAIDGARHRVWVETYIMEPDRVGQRTMDALVAATKRGCDVLLMYDAVGGPRITEAFLKPLRDAGGRVVVFNPLLKWRLSPLLRDHRKIIIIDNHTAFCGGVNLSEDYGSTRHGNGRFHDAHVKVQGPCVHDLAAVLVSSLRMASDDQTPMPLPHGVAPAGHTFVQVLASRGREGRRAIQRAVRLSIRHATRCCYITTPYFIPPPRLIRAINRAAAHGVDVRILTAGDSDVPIVRTAAQHIYGVLLKRGVRIYELFGSTLHAKTMTMDGVYSTVGSFNLDTWSHMRNLEVVVGFVDAEIAQQVRDHFDHDLKQAREVTWTTWKRRPLWKRLVQWAAYQIMQL